MRLAISLAALVLLSGCSTVAVVRDAWNWDPTTHQPDARGAIAPQQIAAMNNRLAQLRLQRSDIRARIGAEQNVRARQRLYEELHRVGLQLSPLERQLSAAAPA